MSTTGFGGYAVVVPIRSLTTAKSRLRTQSDTMRSDLALAFFLDTIAALERSREVDRIVVVSRDTDIHRCVRSRWDVVEDGETGLPAAVDRGIERLRRVRHSGPVAVVLPDLPFATTDAFDLLLSSARKHRRAFLTDDAGTGTTCVAAATVGAVVHRFGSNSAHAHADADLVALDVPVPELRVDVDVFGDLYDQRSLGLTLGEETTEVLNRWRVARCQVAESNGSVAAPS
ncbi:2-phospho-L-lactate guanylyltransferase [Rhodococcus koreensis]